MQRVNENYDHNHDYFPNGKKVTTKADRIINERCNMLRKVQIQLKYPLSIVDIPSNIINNPSFKSCDDLDKIIDVSKLLAQLLNAKVVLETVEESSIKSFRRFPRTRAVSVDADIDFDNEKNATILDETNHEDYTRRYCDKCKKTVFASVKDSKTKNCSDCQTAMTYLCTKFNVKHYKRYPFLKFHWDRCNGNDMLQIDQIDSIDQSQSNTEDANTSEEHINSPFILDKEEFVVKKIQDVNLMEKYVRYCSECDVVLTSDMDRCSTCGKRLLFTCKKCNVKYKFKQSILSHLKSQCYPDNEYGCTHCKYTSICWSAMHYHFKYMHSDRPLFKCEFCPYETKFKSNLNKHKNKCKRNTVAKLKFHCENCNYSTSYEKNLQRHKNLRH